MKTNYVLVGKEYNGKQIFYITYEEDGNKNQTEVFKIDNLKIVPYE